MQRVVVGQGVAGDVVRRLGQANVAGGTPDDMQRYVLSETEKWGKVAKFAGIKPE